MDAPRPCALREATASRAAGGAQFGAALIGPCPSIPAEAGTLRRGGAASERGTGQGSLGRVWRSSGRKGAAPQEARGRRARTRLREVIVRPRRLHVLVALGAEPRENALERRGLASPFLGPQPARVRRRGQHLSQNRRS
jgi:hypothetical protein